ncbi:hypothetical protein MMC31_005655 [Peltigera leucophlebia]|nr:hypothetical protein [Peltigera leucophlebia]
MCSTRILQGVFAINKPKSISSAQVLREIQAVFNPSNLFAPWIEAESAERARNSRNDPKQRRRRFKKVEVKIGHGGTLDPMATGVLIVGVGKGTKHLQSFLECTKAYEATVLFGAETDTYDILGKVLARAPYEHLTEEVVRDALKGFRGKIMQKPPIYSALRIKGKRLYEYAREGKELPVAIQERPVEVEELDVLEWMGAEHAYDWPNEECAPEEKIMIEKLLYLSEGATTTTADLPAPSKEDNGGGSNGKRPRDEEDDLVTDEPNYKRRASNPQHGMSGALPIPDEEDPTCTAPAANESVPSEPKIENPLSKGELNTEPAGPSEPYSSESKTDSPPLKSEPKPELVATESLPAKHDLERPPAVKLHMTVTSGFYVRSLSHDLGKRVGSLGAMCELVRTRQGQFTVGKNVLEYEDLAKGEEVWAPKIEEMLESWERSLEGGSSEPGEGE